MKTFFQLIFQTVIKSDFDIFMFAFSVDWSYDDNRRNEKCLRIFIDEKNKSKNLGRNKNGLNRIMESVE